MSENKYAIGVDFGTESGRAVLVEIKTGKEISSSIYHYQNGVITDNLPVGGTTVTLEAEWALQDPQDYIKTFQVAIPDILSKTQVNSEDVIGLGIDFTACTMMPVKRDGTPLCSLPEYRRNPHAWVKLWKHHAAQPEADKINAVAQEKGEKWLNRYGGKISSEWFFAKTLQILNEAPEIYNAADRLIEAADWVIWQLTGEEKRNSCTAGYKAMWSKREGYPGNDFFEALDPRLAMVIDEKMSRTIFPIGDKAGEITAQAGKEERTVEGMCGVVEDGIIPGLFGYEAGQSGVGDIFAWFVNNCIPDDFQREARERQMDIHQLLEEKAAAQKPGQHGLLALDWWNGNRSVLVDVDLSGLLIGATLDTKAEDVYRAMIEATAYGTRVIIEAFEKNGVRVDELVACGGLPEKNKMLMQIYADVTGRNFKISAAKQTPALGSAMFGAVAAGSRSGGYDTIFEAARHMARLKDEVYQPIPVNQKIYDRLFAEYVRLHDYFGRGENDVMKTLKQIRDEVS